MYVATSTYTSNSLRYMVVGAKHLYWAGTDLHSLLTITCLHNKAAVVTIYCLAV